MNNCIHVYWEWPNRTHEILLITIKENMIESYEPPNHVLIVLNKKEYIVFVKMYINF